MTSLAVFLTHSLVAGSLLVALPIAGIHAAWISKQAREGWRLKVGLVAVNVALGAAFVAGGVVGGEGRAVLNPSGNSLREGLHLAAGESPVPWVVAFVIAAIALTHRSWTGSRSISVSTGLAWLVVGIGIFIATGERRSLLLGQVAVLLLAATQVERWWRASRNRRGARAAVAIVLAALVGSIAVPGVSAYSRTLPTSIESSTSRKCRPSSCYAGLCSCRR